MFRRARGFIRGDRGAVGPLIAIALVGLVGMGALAWDVSRAFALRGELDSVVDAAALAGATQLDGQAGAVGRAMAAAKGAFVQNAQRLHGSGGTVTVTDDEINFVSDLSASPRVFLAKDSSSDASANFIQIDLKPRQLGLITGALVKAGAFDVIAHAVAGYGSAVCVVPPLLVCNPLETCGDKSFDPNANIGKMLLLTPSGKVKASGCGTSNNDWAPGNFGFIDIGTLPDIKDAFGRNTPLTQCFGNTVQSEPGSATTVDQWFNTRFDIYDKGAGGLSSSSLYSPAPITIIGAQEAAGDCKKPTIPTPTGDTDPTPSGPYGFPLDENQTPGTVIGSGVWNWERYFATNHPGFTGNATTDDYWSSYGPNGVVSKQPTRYQVYKWEQALIAGTTTDDPTFATTGPGRIPSSGTADWAQPNCNKTSPSPGSLATDRRVISAVMVNCIGKKGKFTANRITNIDLFLTAPVGDDQTMYGEIIGETSADIGATLGRPEQRFWVRLYE